MQVNAGSACAWLVASSPWLDRATPIDAIRGRVIPGDRGSHRLSLPTASANLAIGVKFTRAAPRTAGGGKWSMCACVSKIDHHAKHSAKGSWVNEPEHTGHFARIRRLHEVEEERQLSETQHLR